MLFMSKQLSRSQYLHKSLECMIVIVMKNAPLLNGVKFHELRIASLEARILYLLGSENTV